MTPKLAKIYRDSWSPTGKLCVIFISFDRDEETMMEYFEEMPWLAVPFNQRERCSSIADKFDVCAIPAVVIMTKEGKELTREGYPEILSMGEGALVHWLGQANPKPPAAVVEKSAAVVEKPAAEVEKPAAVAENPAVAAEADQPAPEANTA
jgi:hypothetical protein